MKKIFSFVAIAAVAATMFTSCSKDDKPAPSTGGQAKLTLSAAPASVAVNAEGEFTVTSDIAAPEAITVTVTSSAAATLTVDPASVTIAKGEKTAKGKFKGIADGKAKITIAASGVTLSVPSVEITVGTPPAPGAEIEKMVTGSTEEDESTYFYGYYEDPMDPNPVGSRANLACFSIIDSKGIQLTTFTSVTEEKAMGVGTLKQQGEAAGEDGIFLTAVTEGTPITFDAMTTSTWGFYETIYTPEYKELATGKDIYIAIACGSGLKGGSSTTYRAWAKINVATSGDFSSFNIIEAYVCLNDGEFKVGQKE